MGSVEVSPALFKMIEPWKIPELENQILDRINYAKQHNTLKELTQKTFEYQANETSLYFQISYSGAIETLGNLILNKVNFPHDRQQVIPLAIADEIENCENASKLVEKILFENFEAIANEVKRQGYWKLPSQLQPQISLSFQKICGFSQPAAEKKKEVNAKEYLKTEAKDLTDNIKGRSNQIKLGGEWITSFEGDLLAVALQVPIRIITVNHDSNGCGIIDMLTFTDKSIPQRVWDTIDEKPKAYV